MQWEDKYTNCGNCVILLNLLLNSINISLKYVVITGHVTDKWNPNVSIAKMSKA